MCCIWDGLLYRRVWTRQFVLVLRSCLPTPQEIQGNQFSWSSNLILLLLNASSVLNKPHLICDLINGEGADLACITETWVQLSPNCAHPGIESSIRADWK